MSELDDFAVVPNELWHRPWFWVVAPVVLLMLAGMWCFLDIPGFVSGDTDIFGEYRFRQEQQAERDQMTRMERIHAELFPKWLIAEANRWDNAADRFQKLRGAVQDPELAAVVDQMASAIANEQILAPPLATTPAERGTDAGGGDAGPESVGEDDEPELNPLHIDLLRRWNDRLEELGEPFYVTGSISMTSSGPALLCEFYRRLDDPVVRVGGRGVPTVILQRIDRTNIVEAYLGVARRGDVAVVVTDRILDLATDSVWLMLNPETTPEDELAKTYANAVRTEATEGLGEEVVQQLAESAMHRRELLDTVDAVRERASCGNTMRFGVIGWDGFTPLDLDRLEAYAERDKLMPCPTMKFAEVDALRDASEELRVEQTKLALQKLVAWLTRMIALHEARHTADELDQGRLEDPATCPGCPARTHRSTRAELSAYLASFAWSDSPVTALYQACTVRGGPHRRAMWIVNRELGRKCLDPPPEDLSAQARALQEKMFGQAAQMSLPADYPAQLVIHRWR